MSVLHSYWIRAHTPHHGGIIAVFHSMSQHPGTLLINFKSKHPVVKVTNFKLIFNSSKLMRWLSKITRNVKVLGDL